MGYACQERFFPLGVSRGLIGSMSDRAESGIRAVRHVSHSGGSGGDRRLYALALALLVMSAGTLYVFGVPPKYLAAILFFLAIAFAALLWGRGSAIVAAITSVIMFGSLFVRSSVPSLRIGLVLVGFIAAGLAMGTLSDRMGAARQKARALAEGKQLLRAVLGTASVGGLAAVLHALMIPPGRAGRLMSVGPFSLTIVLIALLWGRGPSMAAAIASVILVDYLFILPPGRFSVPSRGEGALLFGFIAAGLVVGTLSDRMRAARQEARALAESEQLQRTLLQVISHDLKTPLTTIMGSLHTALDKRLDLEEETCRELQIIAYDQARRLNRLVTGILEIIQLEAGAIRLRREPCRLEDVVDEALSQLRETLGKRQCRIVFPPSLPEVPVDAVLLSQAVANLLDNAARYSPDSSPIEITGIPSGGHVIVDVADRGLGIPASDLERVFEKFYGLRQASAQTNAARGAGLGLAVARGIVEAHGGRIWAEQRHGGGTIIRMSLPLA
jgi:K+-sensing histidine kinase KdpD